MEVFRQVPWWNAYLLNVGNHEVQKPLWDRVTSKVETKSDVPIRPSSLPLPRSSLLHSGGPEAVSAEWGGNAVALVEVWNFKGEIQALRGITAEY